MGFCNYPMGALPQTLRDPIIPLVRSRGSPPRTNDRTRSPVATTTENQNEKRMYPGCLVHVLSGVFYSAVANRRQPNLCTPGMYLVYVYV